MGGLCDKAGVRGYPTIKHGDPNDMEAKIKELQALSAADLDKEIKEKEEEMAAAEKKFTDEVDKLQKRYQELQTEKEDALQAVKDSGLGLMKSVKAAAGKAEL